MNYDELYSMMENVFPLKHKDCGELCNQRCCSNENEGAGMFLFPGEVARFKGADWYEIHELTNKEANLYPFDGSKVYKLICKGYCNRSERPLACRIFPSFPKLHENGVFNLAFDMKAYMMCPLAQNFEFRELDRAFIKSARKIWNELLKDEAIFKRYLYESKEYDQFIESPWSELVRFR